MKKLFLFTLYLLITIALFASSAFAETKNFTTSSSDWWAPNSGKIDMTYSDIIKLNINDCYYSNEKITRIRQEYVNNLAVGLDQKDANRNHLTANASRGTNYPNPYFDKDDDNGDGYWDESETSCGSPSNLSSSSRYYFWQNWAKFTQTGTGTLSSTATASLMGYPEWNTYRYTYLPSFSYDCSKIVVESMPPVELLSLKEHDTIDKYFAIKKNNYYKVKYIPKFDDTIALEQYLQKNNNLINELSSKTDKNVFVVITFKDAISINDADNFINKYNIKNATVTCRAINSQGERITTETDFFNGKIDYNEMLETLKEVEPSGEFKGVYSIRGVINNSNLIPISKEPLVFLADVNTFYVEKEVRDRLNLDANTRINVYIPSPYWYIESTS